MTKKERGAPITANTPNQKPMHKVMLFSHSKKKEGEDRAYGKIIPLEEALYKHPSPYKKTGTTFCCGITEDFSRRKNQWIYSEVIALDFDKEIPSDWQERINTRLDFEYYLYTTHSHTEAKPRFRLVIPLAEKIKNNEVLVFKTTVKEIAKRLGFDCDRCSDNPVQLSITPSHSNIITHPQSKDGQAFPLFRPIIPTEKFNTDRLHLHEWQSLFPLAKKIADEIDLVKLLLKFGYEIEEKTPEKTYMHHKLSKSPKSVEVYNNGTCYSYHSPNQTGSECMVADLQKKKTRISAYDILKNRTEYNPNSPTTPGVKDILHYAEVTYRYDEFKMEYSFKKNKNNLDIKKYLAIFFPKKYVAAERIAKDLAKINHFHSLKKHLQKCQKQWDQKKRIPTFLTDYAGLEDTPLNQELSCYLFRGMLHKIFNDYFPRLIHLVGKEGIGKKTICRLIGGDHWIDIPSGKDDNSIYSLLSRHLVAIDREAQRSQRCKRKNSHIKPLSQLAQSDKNHIRLPYERFSSLKKLYATIFVTSSHLDTDCIEKDSIVIPLKETPQGQKNIQALWEGKENLFKIHRQLWGEAMECLLKNCHWKDSSKLEQHIQALRKQATDFTQLDLPLDAVDEFLQDYFSKGNYFIKSENLPASILCVKKKNLQRWNLRKEIVNEYNKQGKRIQRVYYVKKEQIGQFNRERKVWRKGKISASFKRAKKRLFKGKKFSANILTH